MRLKLHMISTVTGIVLIGAFMTSVYSQSVKLHSNPNAPLKERWNWAEKESRIRTYRDGYWIGYSIEKLMGKHSYTGSFGNNWKDKKTLSEIICGRKIEDEESRLSDAEVIRRAARRALDDLEDRDKPEEKVLKEIAILFQYSKTRHLDDMKLSNLSLYVDLDNLPIIWLGKAKDRPLPLWVSIRPPNRY